jgi:hypothetical protein
MEKIRQAAELHLKDNRVNHRVDNREDNREDNRG